jgi:hypothetical protein
MTHISEFTIVTYQRKPGHWRAAITPKARSENVVRGWFATERCCGHDPERIAERQILTKPAAPYASTDPSQRRTGDEDASDIADSSDADGDC